MSVGSSDGEDRGVMSEINTTPLVDVMLVLLIIFLITIPVLTKTVPLTLPKATNIPTLTTPKDITVSVNAQGEVYWGEQRVTVAQLVDDVAREAVKNPQPEIHIRGDNGAAYKDIGKVIYAINRGGLIKVGFITQPNFGNAQ